MKWLCVVLCLACLPVESLGQEVRVLEFPEFKFESGAVVPNVKLAYRTLGTLNADRSNAILLPSHYGADHSGYDYLIGPGKELDPAKYFLILTNMFANGVSSSPSNTPAPFNGPRFPQVSIRDNVEAQFRLVHDTLGIAKLKAIIGFSMGGQQAYQWAVSYPDMMEAIAVICGNAKQYPFGIVRLQGSINALTADAEFQDGNYTRPPEKGLRAMSMHYRAWTRSPAAWPRNLFDDLDDQQLEQTLTSFSDGFLSHDANNLLSQAETWKRHDVGASAAFAGNLEDALRSIKARVYLLPSASDQYFPTSDSEFESQLIVDSRLLPIQSDLGHAAGGGTDPEATAFIDGAIKSLLSHAMRLDRPSPNTRDEVADGRPMTEVSSNVSDQLVSTAVATSTRPAADSLSRARSVDREIAHQVAAAGQAGGVHSDEPWLVDITGAKHSLREYLGRPHVVILIRGAFCRYCMLQLSEFQERLGPVNCPVVVITTVNDLEELTDIPYTVFADPELSVFRRLKAFETEPLHATYVFSARGDILLKDIGEEPYTDFSAIERALESASAFEQRD